MKTIAKARVTTHRGDVKDWFGQAHVTIDAANLDEITEDLVMGKVSDASGTSVRVLKGDQAGDRAQQGDRTVKVRATLFILFFVGILFVMVCVSKKK